MQIQDIFVISPDGLPYYAKCYGGQVCMVRPDHALQSGFLSAIYQFSSEFGQERIDLVRFEDLQLVYASQVEKGVIVILAVLSTDDEKEVKDAAIKALRVFIQRFGNTIEKSGGLIDSDQYEAFGDDLEREGIIAAKPMKTIPLRKKTSFLRRLFGRKWF